MQLPDDIGRQSGESGTFVDAVGHDERENGDGLDPGMAAAGQRDEQGGRRGERRRGRDDPGGPESDGIQRLRQVLLHFAGGRESLRRIRFERALDDVHERVGQIRAQVVQPRRACRRRAPREVLEIEAAYGYAPVTR